MTKSKALVLAALFYLASILLVFFPFFFLGKTIFSTDLYLMLYEPFRGSFTDFHPFNHFDIDILNNFYLYNWVAQKSLYKPFWVSDIFGGIADYASVYASHFSTLNWILKLGPLHITYPLKLMAFLEIAGLSMFTLLTFTEVAFVPALLAGSSYMFASLFITMFLRFWLPGAFAWVPLIILFAYLFVEKSKPWAFPLVSLFLAFSFLDGFMQSSASILILLGLFLLVLYWRKRKAKGIAPAVGFGLLIVALAFLISAIAWIPQVEFLLWDIAKGGSRAAGGDFYKSFLQRVISIPLLVAGFFPQGVGSPQSMDLTKLAGAHLQDFSLFIGTIPLLLGLASWNLKSEWKKSTMPVALWVIAIAGIAIPIVTPLDRFLYFRFFTVYIFAMAALCGYGFHYLLKSPDSLLAQKIARYSAFLCTGIVALACLVKTIRIVLPGKIEALFFHEIENRLKVQSLFGRRQPQWVLGRAAKFLQEWSLERSEFVIPLMLTVVCVGVFYFWTKKKMSNRTFGATALGLTLAQLGFFVHMWLPFNSLEKYPLFPADEITAFLKKDDPGNRYRSYVNDFNSKEKYPPTLYPPNGNVFYGYSKLFGYEGVRPPTVFDYYPDLTEYEPLGQLNVKYILTHGEPPLKDPALTLRYKGRVAIYENKYAQPRSRLFYNFEISADNQRVSKLTIADIPKDKVLLDEAPTGVEKTSFPPTDDSKLIVDEGNRVSFSVNSPRPALFVLTDTFYPGWKAYWNGSPTKVLRASHLMRAIAIPQGQGTVEFRFEPQSYQWGLRLTLLGFLISLAYFALALAKDRKSRI